MSSSSSLIKEILHKSLAEAVYKDVVTRSSNYYYFLGKTLEWADDLNPPYPTDSVAYERATRNEIITMKKINPSDVAFVIPRKNWQPDVVYDMYDDEYSTQLVGLNVIDGGYEYSSLPSINVSGGGGNGAQFSAIVQNSKIVGIDTISRGDGYTSEPTVTITGGGGFGAIIQAVVNKPYSGASKLENSNFYVLTDDFNVYKCLDNNKNSVSTVKPLGTDIAPIYSPDGYIWKYMYNVPINLRNKFLSEGQMPVISALTNQFYSNGSMESISITNKGAGYTVATITVSGDGHREEEKIFLQSINISNPGVNYSNPTVAISDPVPDAFAFISGAAVFLGQYIFNTAGDFYEVVTPGNFDTTEPSHRFGIVQNGTSALKFVGTRAKATATASVGGGIDTISFIGSVREVDIIDNGSGYNSPPSVSFTGGGGSGATGIVKIEPGLGKVLYVTITNSGDNYSSDPTVTFGDSWEPNTVVFINSQYYYSNRLYTVGGAGTTGSTQPTHTSRSLGASGIVSGFVCTITFVGTTNFTLIGAPSNTIGTQFIATGVGTGTGTVTTISAVNGTAILNYVGTPATGTVVRRFGAGYNDVPTIIINDPSSTTPAQANISFSKTEAKLIPIISDGQIDSVVVQNPGIGYSTATLTVSGDGVGATLTADLSIGNIDSLQANNELLTNPGTINAIKVVSGGYGYGAGSCVIEGDGQGAEAEVIIDAATGRVDRINIISSGLNYTYANVIITGNGFAATARAIISPYYGHGKNSPDELFARTIMFYSNVSTDLNQGLSVNNDYRQVGIIKNPNIYKSNLNFQQIVGSACFVVGTTLDTGAFQPDMDITTTRLIDSVEYVKRYRVVSLTSSTILIQSLDNDQPQINDLFENSIGQTFTVFSVGFPTVDKYSGQMMFIDNKAGFTPSAEETVTLTTVIRF